MAIVYRHIRKDKNQPFYIGIGKTNRAYMKHGRNSIWNRIVSKTDYEIEILFSDVSWEFAVEKEKEFIKMYGRINNNTGVLSNMTDGGEGSPGTITKESTRKLFRQQRFKGNNAAAKPVYCQHLGKSFSTIVECAEELKISQPYLSRMLLGERANKYGVSYMPNRGAYPSNK
jgi:hypothetical protein